MLSSRFYRPAATTLILLLVLSSGCDYVANHDIIIIKLRPDGSSAWSRTLDTGYDDIAADIIETGNGELAIAAGNASRLYESPVPKLVRMSADGVLLADIPCPALSGEITSLVRTRDGNLSAVTYDGDVGWFDRDGRLTGTTPTGMNGVWGLAATADGGVAAAGQLWSQYPAGSVPWYDRNGTLSTRPPLPDESVVTPGCHAATIRAGEKEIPVTECAMPVQGSGQAALALLDQGGSIVLQRGYGAYGFESFWSLAAAAGGGGGYYLSAFGKVPGPQGTGENRRYAVFLRPDGSVGWITDLGHAALYFPSTWDARASDIRLIVPEEYPIGNDSTGIRPVIVALDAGGHVTGRTEIDASRFIIPTADGGFFSAGVPVGGGAAGYTDGLYGTNSEGIHAMKFSANGTREWDRVAGAGRSSGIIKKVIQTSDGGFVILSLRQNPV